MKEQNVFLLLKLKDITFHMEGIRKIFNSCVVVFVVWDIHMASITNLAKSYVIEKLKQLDLYYNCSSTQIHFQNIFSVISLIESLMLAWFSNKINLVLRQTHPATYSMLFCICLISQFIYSLHTLRQINNYHD